MKLLSNNDPSTFEVGDTVEFGEERMTGVIVRVYTNRSVFHVQSGQKRYLIDESDNPIATCFASSLPSSGSVETDH